MNGGPKVSDTYWPRFVRSLRAREGYSQAALAEVLGVDQTSVSRWERGVDEPSMRQRRRMRDLYRAARDGRMDRLLKLRVQFAAWPTSLVGPGAVFMETSPSLLAEIGAGPEVKGRSIYGHFGPEADQVTRAWERTGIFAGDMAMTLSLNEIATPAGRTYIRGLDTPHFTEDGAIWCLCEIKRIGAQEYRDQLARLGGALMTVPFDALA